MIEHEEKRRFTRIKANCAMSFKRVASGSQTHALCVNISGSGLMFEAEEPAERGKALEVRTFPADPMTPPITALIEVIRCTETVQGRYRIAGIIKGIKSQ